MSKLADQLRAVRLFNNFDLLKKFGAVGDVAIEYEPRQAGRLGWCTSSQTMVWSPHQHPKLVDDGLHPPRKRFTGKRAESFQLAINWAMGEFGHDYVPSPFGGYIPDHIRQKARNAVPSTQQQT